MEKQNPLLPFAFKTSTEEGIHLNTTPRDKATIDNNAQSSYHTRKVESKGPLLTFAPSLKRKMGESFNEKDDVKRRDKDLDDIYSEEPTMVDTSSTRGEYPGEYPDKGHENYDEHPPSSPPLDINLSSEYDISTKYNVPQSPSQQLNSEVDGFVTSQKPISFQRQLLNLDSEPDFGIDKFNRFRPSVQCPSTDKDYYDDDHLEQLQKSVNAQARDILIEAFESMSTTIDLEGMGLTEVPHEIKDLNNLVVFLGPSQLSYQVYLTNNKLKLVSPALFKLTKLNVLALRQNKLEKIPGLISNLVNLTDLSIGSNRLKYLPSQILDLPNLQTFRAGPNPFLPIPEDAIPVTNMTFNPIRNKLYISRVKYHHHKSHLIPSLKSLCLSRIAEYDVSYQETRDWRRNTPKIYHNIIIEAIARGNYKEVCDVCKRINVDPYAEVIEWWDILQNKKVPFKKEFCSGMCLQRYKSKILDDIDCDNDCGNDL